jgi:hypothetical protein
MSSRIEFNLQEGIDVAKPIKVFVSYSWKTENDTQIVETLGKLCLERDIKLIRDNQALKHGDSIKQFMDELSEGDQIITVFSKPYFESPWCMYELLRTFQKGNLGERTHPVIADDCDLQDGDYRLDVVKYWVNKYKNGEVKLKGIDPKLVLNEHQQIKLYRDISQNINELLNFAKDRVTTPLPQLKQKNYAQLLDLIAPIVQHDGKAIQQSDEDFLKEIRQNIEFELNKSEHNSFREHLLQACSYKGKTQEFHNYLIDECTSGRFKEIIQYIESVFVDCYDNIDSANINAVKKLYDIAEGTVSKLVVFNIKNDWMTQFRNHSY